MHYQGNPEFTFGFGLSYSNWALAWETIAVEERSSEAGFIPIFVNSTIPNSKNLATIQVKLTNLGPRSGTQTVLLFRIPSVAEQMVTKQNRALIGYDGTRRILEPTQSEMLSIEIQLTSSRFGFEQNNNGNKNIITLIAVTANNVTITGSFLFMPNIDNV
jgi:hypothetical protein